MRVEKLRRGFEWLEGECLVLVLVDTHTGSGERVN